MGKRIEKISQKDMNALHGYSWPGNVRELRNVIEQSMIIASGPTLKVQIPKDGVSTMGQDVSMKDVERKHIINILEQTNWRVRGKNGAA